LTDGGQRPLDIAQDIVEFMSAARHTLDLAQYDFHLGQETAEVVGSAIRAAAGRGVAVRIAYNLDHRLPIPVPPPPEPDAVLISALGVPSKAIAGDPDLMHHKFVVRDGETVWTGSMNWTDDSWSHQENVVVVAHSTELAARFTKDFEQLWESGTVEETGRVDPSRIEVGGRELRAWFTPTYGEDLSHRIANAIGRARRRVRICSPVLTAAPVISTLAQRVSEGDLDLAGCIDATQLNGVFYDWHRDGNAAWKIPILERVLEAPFSGKRSTPYEAQSVHDFMHAKVTVADDVVFTGSFNLSRRGEKNAENMLEIHDAALAERLARFVDEVRARYPRFTR
jgi:phosphatidylserine/phosphatidylglycerophosphate/cardiolipin synthase-like enzyme